MVLAYQTRILKGSIMTPTTRNMNVRGTCAQSVVLSNRISFACWCHNIDKLDCQQNLILRSGVWSQLSAVFWDFFLFHPFQHSNTKKSLRKGRWERTGLTTRWNKLGQAWVRGTGKTRTVGSPYSSWWNRMELEQGGLQIRWNRVEQWTGLCPAEPVHLFKSGTKRLWTVSWPGSYVISRMLTTTHFPVSLWSLSPLRGAAVDRAQTRTMLQSDWVNTWKSSIFPVPIPEIFLATSEVTVCVSSFKVLFWFWSQSF